MQDVVPTASLDSFRVLKVSNLENLRAALVMEAIGYIFHSILTDFSISSAVDHRESLAFLV